MPLIGVYPSYRKPKKKKPGTAISRESFQMQYVIAMESRYNFLSVVTKHRDKDKPEITIVCLPNMEEKFKFYLDAYNEDLELKSNPKIRIIAIHYFDEISPEIVSPVLLRQGENA